MKNRNHGLSEKEMELVQLLMADCETTGDIQAKLKKLFAGTIEQMLEAEMDEHLGYEKNSALGNNSVNSRNGYGKKTITSDYGKCEIAVPRDRNGEFEPKVIEKRQTHTDEILPEVNEWQNCPLDKIYPMVFFDRIVFNSRKDNKIISKCVYSVLGINMEGQKEILGTWISKNESASFYASICSYLKNRGVTDIFIACHDNLTGLCDAINAIFPKTKNQCVQTLRRSMVRSIVCSLTAVEGYALKLPRFIRSWNIR